MADKLNLSNTATEQISFLNARLDLKRHTLCRLALSISLIDDREIEFEDDQNGQEFNRSTIMGQDETVFLSMIAQKEQRSIDRDSAFNNEVRLHIVRGLNIMYTEYIKINSPTEFFKKLISWSDESSKKPDGVENLDSDSTSTQYSL